MSIFTHLFYSTKKHESSTDKVDSFLLDFWLNKLWSVQAKIIKDIGHLVPKKRLLRFVHIECLVAYVNSRIANNGLIVAFSPLVK